jgi:6,7-dimethyl-8-ribityllumazine synthase
MIQGRAEHDDPVLEEASRELEAAVHDVQVAFDCIALGELTRAHTTALTARVAVDAAVTALQAALLTAGALPDPDL